MKHGLRSMLKNRRLLKESVALTEKSKAAEIGPNSPLAP